MRIHLAAAVVAAMILVGCSSEKRPPRTSEQLLRMRRDSDDQAAADAGKLVGQLLKRTKSQYDDYTAHKRANAPVVDILIISGGGDWGAFGAGFLKGWSKIAA